MDGCLAWLQACVRQGEIIQLRVCARLVGVVQWVDGFMVLYVGQCEDGCDVLTMGLTTVL